MRIRCFYTPFSQVWRGKMGKNRDVKKKLLNSAHEQTFIQVQKYRIKNGIFFVFYSWKCYIARTFACFECYIVMHSVKANVLVYPILIDVHSLICHNFHLSVDLSVEWIPKSRRNSSSGTTPNMLIEQTVRQYWQVLPAMIQHDFAKLPFLRIMSARERLSSFWIPTSKRPRLEQQRTPPRINNPVTRCGWKTFRSMPARKTKLQ